MISNYFIDYWTTAGVIPRKTGCDPIQCCCHSQVHLCVGLHREELFGPDVHDPGGPETQTGPLAPGVQPAAVSAWLLEWDPARGRPRARLGEALRVSDPRVRREERDRLRVRHQRWTHPGTPTVGHHLARVTVTRGRSPPNKITSTRLLILFLRRCYAVVSFPSTAGSSHPRIAEWWEGRHR